MEFLGWTNYSTDENWPENKGYIEPEKERLKLWNPNKKLFLSKNDIDQYVAKYNVSKEEARKKLNEENDKLSNWVDIEKVTYWENIYDKCYETLRQYCIDNFIYISDSTHQTSKVPIIRDYDNKYVLIMTLRSWSGFMAEVWNTILKTKKFDYLNFYCDGCPKEIEEFLKLEKENR